MCHVGFEVYNLGRGDLTSLRDFIRLIEESLGKKATIEVLPFQPGKMEFAVVNRNK
jgi:nucleoside-diphosphate-sugar epimerase